MHKPVKRYKYVCQDNCVFIRPDNIGIPNAKLIFKKGINYIGIETNVDSVYLYTHDNKVIGSITNEFLKKHFRLKIKDEEILQHIDLLFENIFFNHG